LASTDNIVPASAGPMAAYRKFIFERRIRPVDLGATRDDMRNQTGGVDHLRARRQV
jgi:hypothetical protein